MERSVSKGTWTFAEATASQSKVLRLAEEEGPQRIGLRRPFGDCTAADLIRHHVRRLTYTAHDMASFARDLGHHGPPFPWDPEQRRHLRARLDALYFHLYGLTRDDAHYILSTFPTIQRQDEAAFGTYRTRNQILAYINALTAGDTVSTVEI